MANLGLGQQQTTQFPVTVDQRWNRFNTCFHSKVSIGTKSYFVDFDIREVFCHAGKRTACKLTTQSENIMEVGQGLHRVILSHLQLRKFDLAKDRSRHLTLCYWVQPLAGSCRRRSHADRSRAVRGSYSPITKVPTMDILLDLLLVIGFMCVFGPFIYRWWTGRDL